MDRTDRLPEGVSTEELGLGVRRLLGSDRAHVTEWGCRSIYEPRIAGTKGVYLLTGVATLDGSDARWAVVLKLLARPPGGAVPLEASLYESGFLARLSSGLTAPRCYRVAALPDAAVALWLEPLTDAVGAWPVERFARAAFHLGHFSGTHARGGALPSWPWLRRDDLRGLVARFADSVAALRGHLGHPLVRRAYPPDVAQEFLRLWDGREAVLDALDRVSPLVCHGDAQRRNLFAGRGLDGADRTIAIDWANLRAAPAGADAKTLVHQALSHFDVDSTLAARLDRAVFDGYLDGLRAGGWRGDARAVRYGYAAQMALGSGVLEVRPVLRMALEESRRDWYEAVFGRPVHEILDRRAATGRFILEVMREFPGRR